MRHSFLVQKVLLALGLLRSYHVAGEIRDVSVTLFPAAGDFSPVTYEEGLLYQSAMMGDSFISLTGLGIKVLEESNRTSTLEIAVGKCEEDLHLHQVADSKASLCCTQERVEKDECTESRLNSLGIDPSTFTGEYRPITIDPSGKIEFPSESFQFPISETARYCVVYANCDPNGPVLSLSGKSVWKSSYGYLPADQLGFAISMLILTLCYLALFAWFALAMHANRDTRIPIEKWILVTIGMGFLETSFHLAHFGIWNRNGEEGAAAISFALLISGLKQGFGRCLILLLCLGWGITRDSLGVLLYIITCLGAVYMGAELVRELIFFEVVKEMQVENMGRAIKDLNLSEFLSHVILILNIIFIFWIFIALNNTMAELRNSGQNRKLDRFRKLRRFLICGICATVTALFLAIAFLLSGGSSAVIWLEAVVEEAVFLCFVLGVAIMWKPNPRAREYAYALELPSSETELELTDSVPSAEAMNDQFDAKDEGPDLRFQIDDAEEA